VARYKGVSREAEHSQSLKKVSHHFCVVVRGMRPSRSLILTPNIHKRNGYQAFMAGVAYVFAEFFFIITSSCYATSVNFSANRHLL
jgi:hypothetical protein